jgi:hypothetical protein
LEEFYHRHALGNFIFDGSQGPWAADVNTPGTPAFGASANELSLADFLAGEVSLSSIALGDPTRLVFVKDVNLTHSLRELLPAHQRESSSRNILQLER